MFISFQAIVGDKYGYRPIPSTISEDVFKALSGAHEHLSTSDDVSWSLVEDWYKKDDNAIPAVFVLQPISSKIPQLSAVSSM